MSALRMTEKVSECLQDILSIADGPHPRILTTHDRGLSVCFPTQIPTKANILR